MMRRKRGGGGRGEEEDEGRRSLRPEKLWMKRSKGCKMRASNDLLA